MKCVILDLIPNEKGRKEKEGRRGGWREGRRKEYSKKRILMNAITGAV